VNDMILAEPTPEENDLEALRLWVAAGLKAKHGETATFKLYGKTGGLIQSVVKEPPRKPKTPADFEEWERRIQGLGEVATSDLISRAKDFGMRTQLRDYYVILDEFGRRDFSIELFPAAVVDDGYGQGSSAMVVRPSSAMGAHGAPYQPTGTGYNPAQVAPGAMGDYLNPQFSGPAQFLAGMVESQRVLTQHNSQLIEAVLKMSQEAMHSNNTIIEQNRLHEKHRLEQLTKTEELATKSHERELALRKEQKKEERIDAGIQMGMQIVAALAAQKFGVTPSALMDQMNTMNAAAATGGIPIPGGIPGGIPGVAPPAPAPEAPPPSTPQDDLLAKAAAAFGGAKPITAEQLHAIMDALAPEQRAAMAELLRAMMSGGGK
jgi:hypothetical protein